MVLQGQQVHRETLALSGTQGPRDLQGTRAPRATPAQRVYQDQLVLMVSLDLMDRPVHREDREPLELQDQQDNLATQDQ